MTDFPVRGQKAPNYWDAQLRAWIEEQVEAAWTGEQVWSESSFSGSTFAGVLNTPVAIEGAIAIVPPSVRPQEIQMRVTFNITVAGGGGFTPQIYDYTNGVPALIAYDSVYIPSSRPTTSAGDRAQVFKRLDPHDDYRVLQGFFTLTRDAGSSLQVGVPNLGSAYTKQIMQVKRV